MFLALNFNGSLKIPYRIVWTIQLVDRGKGFSLWTIYRYMKMLLGTFHLQVINWQYSFPFITYSVSIFPQKWLSFNFIIYSVSIFSGSGFSCLYNTLTTYNMENPVYFFKILLKTLLCVNSHVCAWLVLCFLE